MPRRRVPGEDATPMTGWYSQIHGLVELPTYEAAAQFSPGNNNAWGGAWPRRPARRLFSARACSSPPSLKSDTQVTLNQLLSCPNLITSRRGGNPHRATASFIAKRQPLLPINSPPSGGTGATGGQGGGAPRHEGHAGSGQVGGINGRRAGGPVPGGSVRS